MRLITRYVLVELLKVFSVTLAVMTVLMIIVGAVHEAMLQGLGPVPVMRLIPYLLPNALRFAVPGTILFAACSVFGRMAAWNEVTAVKSLGIPPTVLILPSLVLAFALSLVTVWLNDVAVSWGREGVHRVVIQSVEEIAYGMLRTQRSYTTKQFSISVMRVEGRQLIRPTVIVHGSESSASTTLTAQHAELICNLEEKMLKILLFDGLIEVGGKATMRFPDTFEHEIPLTQASNKDDISGGPSHLPLRQIADETRLQQAEIDRLEKTMAADAAFQMLTGEFAGLTSPQWAERHEELRAARQRKFRLQTEPWRRWATGFSCFFFVLVGAPLSIRLRNADLWTSFAVCFLPILVVYYPLLALGVDRAKDGAMPPYAVWLGNIFLLIAGVWLLRKVTRY